MTFPGLERNPDSINGIVWAFEGYLEYTEFLHLKKGENPFVNHLMEDLKNNKERERVTVLFYKGLYYIYI